jgi:Spy/CpxP family protein refolding chaperone
MFRRFMIIAIIATLAGPAVLAAQGIRAGRANRAGRAVRAVRPARQLREAQNNRGAVAGRVLERLQQRLNLNAAQQDGLRALQENRRTEMESLQQEVQQKREALRQLMQQPNPNANEVGNATLSLKESRESMRGINQRFLAGFKGLLTPDQVQQLPKRLQQ